MSIKTGFEKLKKCLKRYRTYIILFIIMIFFIASAYEYYFKYSYILKNPQSLRLLIMSYGKYSIIVFLLIQTVQVIAFFIPGELVQIAGGYIYGVFGGTILSCVGITIGSIIVYLVSKACGRSFVDNMTAKKDFKLFNKVLKSKNINVIVFILYLIPGIPKDILAYMCGISKIKLQNFIFYSTLGRLPGILISSYFGSKVYSGNKGILILISVIMTSIFIIGVIKSDDIISRIIRNKSS